MPSSIDDSRSNGKLDAMVVMEELGAQHVYTLVEYSIIFQQRYIQSQLKHLKQLVA